MIGAIIGAVVAAGVGAGLSAAMAPDAPKSPDLNAASRAQVEAQAETLADRRRLEAAAQQGGTAQYQTSDRKEKQQFVRVPVPGQSGVFGQRFQVVPYVASEWEAGGKYNPDGDVRRPNIFTRQVKIPGGTRTADFTGYGEADVQGKIAGQMAELQLELSRKYGPAFAEEARKQLELADPDGELARDKQIELINSMIDRQPDRPVATLLDQQVAEQLQAGRGLDRVSQEMLDQAVAASAAARGDNVRGTDFADPLTTGFAGQQRLDASQQKAMGWLASGATPEDVQYRREQQNLANLSALVNNQTPVSQFQTLSGAQQGTTPFMPGNQLAGQNPNAGQAGQSAALGTWNINNQAAMNQVDPWMAGLSLLIGGANVAAGGGWQPLGKKV